MLQPYIQVPITTVRLYWISGPFITLWLTILTCPYCYVEPISGTFHLAYSESVMY